MKSALNWKSDSKSAAKWVLAGTARGVKALGAYVLDDMLVGPPT